MDKVTHHAVVTGGTGGLGRNLIRELREQGWEVSAVHRRESDTGCLEDVATLYEADIRDATLIKRVLSEIHQRHPISCIFHSAACLLPYEHPDHELVNVKATECLAEWCCESQVRLVYISTGATLPYQAISDPRTLRRIDNPYIRTKREGELKVLGVLERGLDVATVMPIIVIGEYMRHYDVFFRRSDLSLALPGKVEFCDVKQVSQSIIRAFHRGRCGEHYVLGGEYLSWFDFFSIVAKIVGSKPPTRVLRHGELMAKAYWDSFGWRFFGVVPEITPSIVKLLCREERVLYDEELKALRDLGHNRKETNMRRTCTRYWRWLQGKNQMKTC
jgi:nucleoside-diphosphate-sugar epimerase